MDNDAALAVAVGPAEDTFVTGVCQRRVDFGEIRLNARGSTDAFVARLSRDGRVLWAVTAGGSGGDGGTGIAVTGAGNICVAGHFDSQSNTNPPQFGDAVLESAGNVDIFVAQLDMAGSLKWVRTAGGVGRDEPHAIAADSDGNCYLVGEFEGESRFGDATLVADGIGDVFVAKYDSAGRLVWANRAGGPSGEEGLAIAVDETGEVYATGRFSKWAMFGATKLTAKTEFDNQVDTDVFVTKIGRDGSFVWAIAGGGFDDDVGRGIAVDRDGRCYVTGTLRSATSWFGAKTVVSDGSIFVAGVKKSGEFDWIATLRGAATNDGRAVALGPNGNLYVVGAFTGAMALGQQRISAIGQSDAYVAVLSPSGDFRTAMAAGGPGRDTAYGIAVDRNGQPRIAGEFEDSFGTVTGQLNSHGGSDCFVWQPGQVD